MCSPSSIPMASKYSQPAPLPQPSSILCGDQIRMSGLYMYHRNFSITLDDKYQYQWNLIRSIPLYRSHTHLSILELINYWWKVLTPNWHHFHDLPQYYRASKYVCLVCIWPTDNLQQHPSTSIRVNEFLYSQFHSTITQQHMNNYNPWGWTQNNRISSDRVLVLNNRISDSKQNQLVSWL